MADFEVVKPATVHVSATFLIEIEAIALRRPSR
jgi:hypothetical protein